MSKTTKEQKLEIIRLYESNKKDSTELSEMFGVTKSAIIGLLHRNNIEMRNRGGKRRKYKYSLKENFFSQETEDSSYWAGFISADGNIYNPKLKNAQNVLTIEISVLDELHLRKFNIGTDIYYRPSRSNNILGMCSKSISSNIICDDLLKKYNITPNKSLNLEFPNITNPEMIRHFIRGYFDGDGCFCIYNSENKKYCCYDFLGTEKFLTALNEYLPIKAVINKRSNCNIFSLKFYGHSKCKIIYDYLYTNSNIFLERKKNKAELYLQPYL